MRGHVCLHLEHVFELGIVILLDTDVALTEGKDLAAQKPEIVARMRTAFEQTDRPRFEPRRRGREKRHGGPLRHHEDRTLGTPLLPRSRVVTSFELSGHYGIGI